MSLSYRIFLHPQAERELDGLPDDLFRKMDKVIRQLQGNPRPLGVKKLQDNLHRIRVGNWRIIYTISDRESRVIILRIVRRSERTYKGLD